MKTDKIEIGRDILIEVYEKSDENVKKMLEDLYGVEMFRQKNVMDRVKDIYTAINELGGNHPFVEAYFRAVNAAEDFNSVAYQKLRIITAALNEGWEPQFTKNEKRYYPCIYVYAQNEIDDLDEDELNNMFLFDKPIGSYIGVKSVDSEDMAEQFYLSANSQLCFKSRELSDYAGEQFIDIYADFYLK